jgi:hypothetical protein
MCITNACLLFLNIDLITLFLVLGIPLIGASLFTWFVYKRLLKTNNKYLWLISILSFMGGLIVLYVLVVVILVLLVGILDK